MKKITKDEVKVACFLSSIPLLLLLAIYIRKFSGDFWYNLFF